MKGKVRTVRCKAFGCPFPFLNNKFSRSKIRVPSGDSVVYLGDSPKGNKVQLVRFD